MRVVVHSAAIQDRDGAGLVLDKVRWRFPWLELIWADGGYNAWQVDAAVARVPPGDRQYLAAVKRIFTLAQPTRAQEGRKNFSARTKIFLREPGTAVPLWPS